NTAATGTVTLSETTVRRVGNGAIHYNGVASLLVNGTSGGDTFSVFSTHDHTVTTIDAGDGDDLFTDIEFNDIGDAGLTLHAGGDGEAITLFTLHTGTIELRDDSARRVGNGTIHYDGFASLALASNNG